MSSYISSGGTVQIQTGLNSSGIYGRASVGHTGPTGPRGPMGMRGPMGPTGPRGSSGSDKNSNKRFLQNINVFIKP